VAGRRRLRGVLLEPGHNTLVIESDGDRRALAYPRYSGVSAAMMIGSVVVEQQR